MLTYHHRTIAAGGLVVMPYAFVTTGIGRNLGLLIDPFDTADDPFEGNGFVSSILANVGGDKEIVRERLREERVPQMLLAAAKTMIDIRKKAPNLPKLDAWSTSHLQWVSGFIERQGLQEPSAEDVDTAGLEYTQCQRPA